MVSTKITSSSVAEIDAKLKTYIGDMIKIEYLENCLKQMPIANDVARFCHLKLSDLYASRLMYGPAARNMDYAAENAVTFKDKIAFYMKEIPFLLKLNDYLAIDKVFKKAMLCANTNEEKEALKQNLKKEMLTLASEYEKKNRRSSAAQIYERMISMPLTNDAEKRMLMEKAASLNSKMGRLSEAIRYEQMLKRPIEKPRSADPDTDVKRVSFEDLGLEEVK